VKTNINYKIKATFAIAFSLFTPKQKKKLRVLK
jgi:hypothetical protein